MLIIASPRLRRVVSLVPVLLIALLVRTSFAGNEKNYTYLALGDSVAFGLDVRLLPSPLTPPPVILPSPDAFTGYPEVVADIEHLLQSKKEVNAACPGETSGSFMNVGNPDYGCNSFRE